MKHILSLLSLAPVLRGFIALIVSGTCFPLCGVMVLQLDLIPLRYMLMHGVILGGAIALACQLPLVPVIVIINIVLVLYMLLFKKTSGGFSGASAGVMVLSIALASVITHVADVPAKDTLNLLWGSPFALTVTNQITVCALALLLVVYVTFNYKNMMPLFFNTDVARAMGINVHFHYTVMVMLIALVVSVSMQLLGAFLIDALLILPVLCASSFLSLTKSLRGIKKLFAFSSVIGFIFSFGGFFISLALDTPPAATIALMTGLLYTVLTLIVRCQKKHKRL